MGWYDDGKGGREWENYNDPTGAERNEGKSSSCFMIAVYGNSSASEVIKLRTFRDEVLTKHYLGRIFVKLYYKVSPPIADWLREKPKTSHVVRLSLNQFIRCI
jgi:hypothetical protein